MYAFDNAHDVYFQRIVGSWNKLGIGRFGPAVRGAVPTGAHELISTKAIGNAGQSHGRTVSDHTPVSRAGVPDYRAVWSWMLKQVLHPASYFERVTPALSSNTADVQDGSTPFSLGQLIADRAAQTPNAVYLEDARSPRRLSYAQFADATNRWHRTFEELGFAPGASVLVDLRDTLCFAPTMSGAAALPSQEAE
ncbi:MAG TPA: hypothetical protein VIJ18_13650 [Microbacteriaceae bacterium]